MLIQKVHSIVSVKNSSSYLITVIPNNMKVIPCPTHVEGFSLRSCFHIGFQSFNHLGTGQLFVSLFMLHFLWNLVSIYLINPPDMSVRQVITLIQIRKPASNPNGQIKEGVNSSPLIVPSNQAFYTQIVPSSGPMLPLKHAFLTESFYKMGNLGIITEYEEIVRLGFNDLPCPLNAGFFFPFLLNFPSQLQHISLG